MKTGDLILFSPDTILGKLIRFRTGYDITHIGFLFKADFADGHVLSLEALDNGTTFNRLSKRIQYYRKGHIYWLPLKEEYDVYREYLGKNAFIITSCKFPHDNLFYNLISPIVAEYERHLCTDYCFLNFRRYALMHGSKSPYPGEFEKLEIFKEKVKLI